MPVLGLVLLQPLVSRLSGYPARVSGKPQWEEGWDGRVGQEDESGDESQAVVCQDSLQNQYLIPHLCRMSPGTVNN